MPRTARRYNPYRSQILRRNLRLYLHQMATLEPRVILVGEALGYRGGRLTGIPFSCESLLFEGPSPLFGRERGYQLPKKAWSRPLKREQTATIVWETMSQLPQIPLMWNAYPFHPHKPAQPQSNRAPSAAELTEGVQFLQALIALFDIKQVIAVGNKAEKSLTKIGQPHNKVRHPAYGGKADFVRGIQELIS